MKSKQEQREEYKAILREEYKAILQHAKELLPSIIIKYGRDDELNDSRIEGIIAEAITIASKFDIISDEVLCDPEKQIEIAADIVESNARF
jgi:CRISPR/Cas system CMR-associated protein Cmr5 small subunit